MNTWEWGLMNTWDWMPQISRSHNPLGAGNLWHSEKWKTKSIEFIVDESAMNSLFWMPQHTFHSSKQAACDPPKMGGRDTWILCPLIKTDGEIHSLRREKMWWASMMIHKDEEHLHCSIIMHSRRRWTSRGNERKLVIRGQFFNWVPHKICY